MANHSDRPPRLEITEQCKIVRENGGRTNGKLINLSDEGFCVESRHFFSSGERIEIHLSGAGRISGIVRWCHGGRAGGVVEPYSRGAVGS